MQNYINNNIEISGTVLSTPTLSHQVYGEKFYNFLVSVQRLSETVDEIVILISERLLFSEIVLGENISLEGQIRSYNKYKDNGKSQLVITMFVTKVNEIMKNHVNVVNLEGTICKKPSMRKTPFGREITDFLIAINRNYNKSDYIPCIGWGRNAKFLETLDVGTKISVSGRLQSRKYTKKYEDGKEEDKTAYEVSISSLLKIEEDPSTEPPSPEEKNQYQQNI